MAELKRPGSGGDRSCDRLDAPRAGATVLPMDSSVRLLTNLTIRRLLSSRRIPDGSYDGEIAYVDQHSWDGYLHF